MNSLYLCLLQFLFVNLKMFSLHYLLHVFRPMPQKSSSLTDSLPFCILLVAGQVGFRRPVEPQACHLRIDRVLQSFPDRGDQPTHEAAVRIRISHEHTQVYRDRGPYAS